MFCPQLVHPLLECRVDQRHSNNWNSDRSRHVVVLVVVNRVLAEMSRHGGVVVHDVRSGGAPLFNNVQTTNSLLAAVNRIRRACQPTTARCAIGRLAVPNATLDNELQPVK